MRWTNTKIKFDEVRKHSSFLLFPKELWNPLKEEKETRWLEYTTWVQDFIGHGQFGIEYWTDKEWSEEID